MKSVPVVMDHLLLHGLAVFELLLHTFLAMGGGCNGPACPGISCICANGCGPTLEGQIILGLARCLVYCGRLVAI